MIMQKESQPMIVEKYGLKYYSFILIFALMIGSFQLTQKPHIGSFLFNLIALVTTFTIDDQPIKHPRYHNKNIFLLFPLYTSCFMSIFSICYLWYRYEWVINCSWTELPLNMLYIAFTIGGSIDACHQLLHRNEKISKAISFMTLIIYQFTTYPIQHLYVHHKKVGTQQDPITSPKNKSLYRYYVQAILSSYIANYRYSKKIFCACLLANFSYVLILSYAAYREGLSLYDGFWKVAFFISLSYFCLFALQTVQYIEHYGLIYRKGQNSSEKVQEICAWNTEVNSFLTYCIFRFQRHSDHHMNAYKIYSTMQLTDKMPRFPASFVAMGYISYIPPLWYSYMNPLADKVVKRQSIEKQQMYSVKKVAITMSILFTLLAGSKLIPMIM